MATTNKQHNQPNRRKKGPKVNQIHLTLLAATAAPTTTVPPDYSLYVAEIQRLQSASFDMPVAQQATLLSSARPRKFYCWLYGWNNTHHGTTCKIIGADAPYTGTMKAATGPKNTGGNPKVGVPVHLHRTRFILFVFFILVCLVCPHYPPTRTHTPPLGLSFAP
jgi:hypothetical protein